MSSLKILFSRRLIEAIDVDDLKIIFKPLKSQLIEKEICFSDDDKIHQDFSQTLQNSDDFDKDNLAKIANDLYVIQFLAKKENSEHLKKYLGKDFDKDDSLQKQVC